LLTSCVFMMWGMRRPGPHETTPILRSLLFVQFGLCCFFLIAPNWPFAYLLMVSSAAGVVCLRHGPDSPVLNSWFMRVCCFNTLGSLGLLSFFNLGVNFMDSVATPQAAGSCNSYYPWNAAEQGVCKEDGYSGFLRFIAVIIIAIQPLMMALHANGYNEGMAGGAAAFSASAPPATPKPTASRHF
jgi:hypothetical protein